MNTYSVDAYIALGYTEKEAQERVERNKKLSGTAVSAHHKAKRLEKYKNLYKQDTTIDDMVSIENKIRSLRMFKDSISVIDLYSDITTLMNVHNVSIYEIYDVIYEIESRFSDVKKLKSNTNYIKELYGEESEQYRRKLEINKSMASCSFEEFSKDYDDKDEARKKFNEKYTTATVESIAKKRNISIEEAKEVRNAITAKTKETWSKKPEEELSKIFKKRAFLLENLIDRYGTELGTLKYNEQIAARKGVGRLQWYIEKYGEESGKQMYFEKRGKHNIYYCKEYWTTRGMSDTEAEQKIKELFESRPSFSLDFCKEKYGEEKGYAVWKARNVLWQNTLKSKPQAEIDDINKRKSFTLERSIEKYGEEVGRQFYQKMCDARYKALSTRPLDRVSKISIKFFMCLYRRLRRLGIVESKNDVVFGYSKNPEYYIYFDNRIKFYDFCIPSKKIIIEYNGSTWHPREGDTLWKNPHGASYDEVIENDRLKYNVATENGFSVHYVWGDCDFQDELNKATLFIMDLVI